MAALLAQLPGPINLRLVLSDLKLTDILHDLVTAKGNRSGVPRVLAVDRNEPRELAGTLHLEAPGVPPVYSYTDNVIPAMTSYTAPSGVASASSENTASLAAWKAFNHANAAQADSWWPTAGTGSVQYQFPSARTITRYAVTSNFGFAEYAPKSWTFEGSINGTDWDTLDTQTNVISWATPLGRKVYDIANATAYAYYRLDITAGNYADNVGVGELEMMETMISSYGSGKDDAIAQIRAINALVTVGTTLILQSTGATNAVTLNILPSRGVSQPLDELFELDGGPVLASCAFSFTCEPYAYGPTQVVYSGSVTLPDVIDIDVLGDYKTPLNIAFNATSDALHALYMGLLPSQWTPLSWLLKPSAYAAYSYIGNVAAGNPSIVNLPGHGLVTGMTVEFWNGLTTPATNGIPYVVTVVDGNNFTIPVAVTEGSNVNVTLFTTPSTGVQVVTGAHTGAYGGRASNYSGGTAWARWEVDDRMLPPGTYLPLVRAAQEGAGTNNLRFGDSFITERGIALADTGAAFSLEPMPQAMHLPWYKMTHPGATWCAPALWWLNGGGVETLDYLALLPTTWGWASYHPPNADAGSYMVTLGYDGIFYDTMIANDCGRSSGMSAVGEQSIFMVPGARHDAARFSTIDGNLLIVAIPRYALWR